MKIKLFVALALVTGLAINSADAQITSGRHQKGRVEQGMRSGELNRFEKHRLGREKYKIHRHRRQAWKNDGRISPRERKMLQQERRKHNRHIYRYKHNRFDRNK